MFKLKLQWFEEKRNLLKYLKAEQLWPGKENKLWAGTGAGASHGAVAPSGPLMWGGLEQYQPLCGELFSKGARQRRWGVRSHTLKWTFVLCLSTCAKKQQFSLNVKQLPGSGPGAAARKRPVYVQVKLEHELVLSSSRCGGGSQRQRTSETGVWLCGGTTPMILSGSDPSDEPGSDAASPHLIYISPPLSVITHQALGLFEERCPSESPEGRSLALALESFDSTEALTPLELWLHWSFDSTGALTPLKLWLHWSFDSTEALTPLKLWLHWSLDSTGAWTPLELGLHWSFDSTLGPSCLFDDFRSQLCICWL